MRKLTLVLALMVSLTASRADADLILSGTINGVNFCATDNNLACAFGLQLFDTSGALGVLALDTALIGGVEVAGSLHTSTFGPPQNILNSSSLSINNLNAAAVNFLASVSATNFLGPNDLAFTTGSGTWVNSAGSSIDLSWYNDPTNQQGAEFALDRPGNLIDAYNDIAGIGIDSFSHNGGPFGVNDPALFSMTLGFDGTLMAGASLISRGQSEVKELTPVPEPGSMLLLGSGLAFGARKLRQRARRNA